jgi:outer membrane protein TolC
MNKLFIIALCCLISVNIKAQHSFSVQEAQEFGLTHNNDIKNAELDVEHAAKQMLETISVGLPQINAEMQWQNFLEVPTTLMPGAGPFGSVTADSMFTEMQFGIPHTTTASVTASQLIFNGSYIVGLKASKEFMNFANTRKDLTELQIKDSIATAYYNVLIASENEQFLNNLVIVHKDIVEEIEARYTNGFVEDIEVDRMALVLSEMEMQYANIQRQYVIAEAYLKLIIGIPLSESLTLTDSLGGLLESSVNFQLEEAQIHNRLEYQMAEMQVKLKELDMRRYQTDKLPTVSAFASFGSSAMGNEFNAFQEGTNWYPSQLVGVKITLPIFDGLGGMARIQKARLKYEQAKNDKNFISQNLELAHYAAQSNYLNAISNYHHQESNLALSKKIYDKTLAKYREGLVSSLELSQAGTEYLESNSKLSTNTYNLLISNMNYQRSLGK